MNARTRRSPLQFWLLVLLPAALLAAHAAAQRWVLAEASRAETRIVEGVERIFAADTPEPERALLKQRLLEGRGIGLHANLGTSALPRILGLSLGLSLGASLGVSIWLSATSRPRAGPRTRVLGLSGRHAVGLMLLLLGGVGIAAAGAWVNAWWIHGGQPIDPRLDSTPGIPDLASVARIAAPLVPAGFAVACGVILLATTARDSFDRMSRVRALAIGAAATGATLVAFSLLSVRFCVDRWSALPGLDPLDPALFPMLIGSASLTKNTLPAGMLLVPLGLVSLLALPAFLRRRPGWRISAGECLGCGHALSDGQLTCPECGLAQECG